MTELLIVLFVALLVFGATKIPAVGDALGRALRGPGARARGGEPDQPPARRVNGPSDRARRG